MKKTIAVAVVIAGLGLAGLNQASAGWGRGGGGGNFGNCPQFPGGQYSQIDPAGQQKMDQFLGETQEIRKEMAMKQAERQALLRTANPDPATMSRITGELFDLRTALQQKAEESGVSEYMGPRGGRGFGPGMGGFGRGGRNMGYMMNNSAPGAGRF